MLYFYTFIIIESLLSIIYYSKQTLLCTKLSFLYLGFFFPVGNLPKKILLENSCMFVKFSVDMQFFKSVAITLTPYFYMVLFFKAYFCHFEL